MIEKLNEKYDEFKNIIDILPTNTKFNSKRKLDLILEEEQKDASRLDSVKKEIEARIAGLKELKENDRISVLEGELEKCNIVNEWNNYNTSYEKMHLDYYLYQLHRYYKEDLDSVNTCIKKIIESFSKVNVVLTKDDFDYNKYAAIYMDRILNSAPGDELRQCFEELYWKESDIIKMIEINFKGIYLKNEKKINKYYEERHEEFLQKHNDIEIYNMRVRISDEIKYLKGIDPYINLQKFLNKEYLIKDYTESEIIKKRQLYFTEDNYNFEGLKRLYKTLTEYNILLKYNYLLTDMRSRLEKKEELKNVKENALKEIEKDQAKLIKLMASRDKKSLFGLKKNNDEQWLFEYKSVANGLAEKFASFDNCRFNELVYNKLTKDSCVTEILKFVSSHYLYFVDRTKELDETLTIEAINDRFEELRDELYNNNNYALISNLVLLDERQIKDIIIDKYNLENITLTKEILDKENIEATINNVLMLINYEYLVASGIKTDDVALYIEYSKLTEE